VSAAQMRAFATPAAAVAALALLGATPAAKPPGATRPTAAARIPVPRTPTTRQHSEFVVEVNRKGQVIRADRVKPAQNDTFNAMTYGNVLQAFIRRPDGSAVSGIYRMTYDYDPKRKTVRRQVALLHAGRVDPDALGAVDREMEKIESERARERLNAPPTPSPLPDLKAITGHRH
jgi:hypothetical protein